MPTVTVPVTDEGIRIPSVTVANLGYRVGDLTHVELRPVPDAEELQDKTLPYVFRHCGDAVHGEAPVWVGDGWRSDLKIRGQRGSFGRLFLSPEGHVEERRSSTRAEMPEAVDAQGSVSGSTG